MQRNSLYVLSVITALLIVFAFPLSLAAQEEMILTSTSSIVDSAGAPLEKGMTTLVRQADGVSIMMLIFDLTPGDAYTTWWDIPGVPDSLADGQVIGDDGVGLFTAFLALGDFPDPMEAEIGIIARTHGPVIPDIADEMISTVNGGCPPNRCANVFESVHPSPSTMGLDEGEEAHKQTILRVIDEAFNQGNLDVIDELFAPDYVSYDPGGVEGGREEFKEFISAFRAAMPDYEARVDLMVAEGDWIAFRFNSTGTFENEHAFFPGLAPTGEPVAFSAHVVLRFNKDGQIAEEWDMNDNFGFLTQVGVLAPPE